MKADNVQKLPIFVIQWHITALCDQACKHCYMVNSPEMHRIELLNELTTDECKAVIDSFMKFCEVARASPAINFTGGDPLLRHDFFELLEYAHARKIRLSIMGNPFHLTARNIAQMKSLGVVSYQVSLDGMEDIHDSIRMPGSFSATVEAIKLLNSCGMRSVVMFTLSKLNSGDLPEVMRLVDKLGVNAFAFARLSTNPVISTKISPQEIFAPLEYREFLLKIQSLIEELKANGSKTHFTLKDHLWTLLLYEQGKYKLGLNNAGKVVTGCHMGERDLAVLADGTVYACRRFHSPVGKMPQQSVLEVFTSDAMDCYREIQKLEKCSKCPLLCHCRGCPAVAAGASGGDFYAPDPQCWQVVV